MARQCSLDQFFALLLFPLVIVVLAILFVVVVPLQGRPFFFASERMRKKDQAFFLFKIRTMYPVSAASGQSALGGDQQWRVTPVGAVLRRTRLDELPQIFNVLRGDIRFIGPRPPLRKYVDLHPKVYGPLLASTPPGITGLATVFLHRREERLLAQCRTDAETETVYQRRCIPLKTRLDLIYRDRKSVRLNILILYLTLSRLIPMKINWYPKNWSIRSALESRDAYRRRQRSPRALLGKSA